MGQGFSGSPVPTVPLPLLVHSQPISLTPEGDANDLQLCASISVQSIVHLSYCLHPQTFKSIPFQRDSVVRDTHVAHDRLLLSFLGYLH